MIGICAIEKHCPRWTDSRLPPQHAHSDTEGNEADSVRIAVISAEVLTRIMYKKCYTKLTSSVRRFPFSRRVYQIRRVSTLSVTIIAQAVQYNRKRNNIGEIVKASWLLPAERYPANRRLRVWLMTDVARAVLLFKRSSERLTVKHLLVRAFCSEWDTSKQPES